MKKILTGTALILLFAALSPAQEQECPFTYGAFIPQSDVYLFGDKVNVRSAASAQSALVSQKSIGSRVTVLEEQENQYTLGGYTTNWYKVRYKEGVDSLTGFVVGGLLSLVTADLPAEAESPDQLLYGVTSWSKEQSFMSTVRIVRDGKLLASLDFPPISSGFFDAGVFGHGVCITIEGNHGFKGIKNVIRIKFIYEACGYENGEILLLWDGAKLTYLAKASQVTEAGVFRYLYTLIFPNMEGGKPDTLQIIQELTEYEFEGESEKVTNHEITIKAFSWDGKAVSILPEEVKK